MSNKILKSDVEKIDVPEFNHEENSFEILCIMIEDVKQNIDKYNPLFEDGYLCEGKEFQDRIESLCNSVFINFDGSVNWSNIRRIRDRFKDIDVYAGEKDSFGWLTGVLDINDDGNNMVVFG